MSSWPAGTHLPLSIPLHPSRASSPLVRSHISVHHSSFASFTLITTLPHQLSHNLIIHPWPDAHTLAQIQRYRCFPVGAVPIARCTYKYLCACTEVPRTLALCSRRPAMYQIISATCGVVSLQSFMIKEVSAWFKSAVGGQVTHLPRLDRTRRSEFMLSDVHKRSMRHWDCQSQSKHDLLDGSCRNKVTAHLSGGNSIVRVARHSNLRVQ